ncbi:hypothetical protein BDZ85DRAFT_263607 [Elsinoe ampelina]|uniref:Uncharacterized protein n=1 Tax=Elsinoe ampelina TaxID=302913 RepID=A0A6A6G9N1_9PEZI|nr:hypothetical protein BDZ85DRAFT_263607 [Elsinoe ampelina]
MAEQQQNKSILPTLPSITTTISSLLQSPITQQDNSAPNTANDRSIVSPASLANFMPSTPTWWRRPAAKPDSKSAGNSPRLQTPTGSTMFSPIKSPTDELSRRGSSESVGDSTKKRKRNPRPKTSYTLCHAPPRHGGRHKIQVRARPLLQLHKIESRARPRPAFELLPSAIFSPRLIKAIAKFSSSKNGLSPQDLAVVRAEKYHAHEASPSDEDETRDILALICGIGKGHNAANKVRICLEQGVEWEACQLPTGSYEFTTTDDHGLNRTVRWVPKRNVRGVSSPIASPVDGIAEKKFNFSTISANTRRHPVIAHLTPTSLDISDVYNLPVPSTSVDSGAPTPISPSFNRTSSDDTVDSIGDSLTTTDELRNIITATAVYVAICEKWCTSYRSEDSLQRSASQKSVSPSKPNQSPASPRKRPSSLDSESIRRSSSLRQALRSPGFRRKLGGDPVPPNSSNSSLALDTSNIPTIPEADSPVASRRKRADTTSTVIINGNGGQWRPNYEDETDDEEEEPTEEERKDTAHSSPTLDAGKSDKGSVKARRSTESEKKRHFSESTLDGSETSADTVAREKKTPVVKVKEKKGFLSKLLCGMV